MKYLILLFAAISLITISYLIVNPQTQNLRQEQEDITQSCPEMKLQFIDYVTYFNYPSESHYITTEDGFILNVFRIQAKNTQIKSGLPVILLQHGLMDSSDSQIMHFENKSIGFTLANAGYDVWFGNSRGNYHSRNHSTYDPKQKKFWQWSFQEMADYDLPAVFTYINQKTEQKINYIGHSQGTTQMFAALSEHNPVVEANIKKFIALGPVAFVRNITSPFFLLSAKIKWLFDYFAFFNINEQLARADNISKYGAAFCEIIPAVCDNILKYIMDADPQNDEMSRADVYLYHEPSGASTQDFHHWQQMVVTGEFKKFDYGNPISNLIHYQQTYPPFWNISEINIPVHLFVGSSDELADPIDANYTLSLLQKGDMHYYEGMGHATFLIGKNMSYVNDVLAVLSQDDDE